jgi:hypothetical protein
MTVSEENENFTAINAIPSHVSPPVDGIVYVTYERRPYRVVAGTYDAQTVREAFGVPDNRDLWLITLGGGGIHDVKVEDTVMFDRSGLRFYPSPRYING